MQNEDSPSSDRSAKEHAAHRARVAFHVACTEKLEKAPPSVRLRAKRLHTENSPGSWSRFCTKSRGPARKRRRQRGRESCLSCVHAPSAKQTQRLEDGPIRQVFCLTLEMLRQFRRVTLSRRDASPKLAVLEKYFSDTGLQSTSVKLQRCPEPRG